MHITLVRRGGIIPVTKKAEMDVDWSANELNELLKIISIDDSPGQKRDATAFELETNAGTSTINLEAVPAKYKKTFEQLKDKLAVSKL